MNPSEYDHMYGEEEVHWWYVGMRKIVGSMLESCSISPGARVLDAGCGTGFNMGWLRQRLVASVTGIDVSTRALAFSYRRGERQLVRGDVSGLPFQTACFDLVTSFDVLSHVSGEEQRFRTLLEFLRVLRPGGFLMARVAAHEWLRSSHDSEILTQHRYSEKELCRSVSAAGFTVIRSTYANAILFPVGVLWRIFKKVGLAPAGSDVRPTTRGSRDLNQALSNVLTWEAGLLRRPRYHLPMGLSLIVLAQKPALISGAAFAGGH